MSERLTDAEVAAVRERWEATERRIVGRETAAKRAGAMGDQERIRRPEGHEDIPRLLATLEASEARVRALTKAGDAMGESLDAAISWFDPPVQVGFRDPLTAWRALTRGGDDGE